MECVCGGSIVNKVAGKDRYGGNTDEFNIVFFFRGSKGIYFKTEKKCEQFVNGKMGNRIF